MFVANKGNTQTKVYNNKEYKMNEVNWDAKYDGKIADINLDINDNGNKKNLHMSLNNEDLAQLLTVPSVGNDLQKRLKNDFKHTSLKKPIYIELGGDGSKETNKHMISKKYSKKFSVKRKKKYNPNPKTLRVYFHKK
jgi:hypothetical protein